MAYPQEEKMMPEQTRLTVLFDGEEPSLKNHRLSISAFVDSLNRLVQALRRIASGIDSDAWGSAEYGRRGGRYTKEAEGVDWEIVSLDSHSPLQLSGIVVQRLPESPDPGLFEPPESTELTDLAAERLLVALDKESKEQSDHQMVRNYLRSLPKGVTRQEYEVSTTSGQLLDRVVISDVELPEEERDLPYLEEIAGEVIGVGFDPGQNEVRVKGDSERLHLAATAEQVDSALRLRGEAVTAFFVRAPGSKKSRLLQIRAADEPRRRVFGSEAEEAVFERWGCLLKRLAE